MLPPGHQQRRIVLLSNSNIPQSPSNSISVTPSRHQESTFYTHEHNPLARHSQPRHQHSLFSSSPVSHQHHVLQAWNTPRSLPPAPSPAPPPEHPSQDADREGKQYSTGEQSSYPFIPSESHTLSSTTADVQTDYRVISYSMQGADPNSASQCQTPRFTFVSTDLYRTPIRAFRCTYPLLTCLAVKTWLLHQFTQPAYSAPNILRMEAQSLHLLGPRKAGLLLVLRDACHSNGDGKLPVTILALLLPHDDRIRWFYTILSTDGVLSHLENELGILEPKSATQYPPSCPKHKPLYCFLRTTFEKAVSVPHHPDYLAAQAITDYCPSILDPETAMTRLESNLSLIHISEPTRPY